MRGSEMAGQTTGQGFIAEPGSRIFSQREPLGTIRAQLTKATSFFPACHSFSAPGEKEAFGELREVGPGLGMVPLQALD